MKYRKTLLIVVSATGLAAAALIWSRHDESQTSRTEKWIVDTAVAMSRAEIGLSSPHSSSTWSRPGGVRDGRDAVHEAQQLRVQRRFAEAAAAYREAIRANPMDADSWADLADALAAAAGNDLTAGRDAIMHALAVEPRHSKALWLRASLELQEGRYAAAAATWRELEPLVSPGSADARVIAANIVEADALAAQGSGQAEKGG